MSDFRSNFIFSALLVIGFLSVISLSTYCSTISKVDLRLERIERVLEMKEKGNYNV